MRKIWIVKRCIEKIEIILRSWKTKILYGTTNKITILGKVYLNNPNIHFGKNVVLYPGVHIFGQGKVTLGNNVSIGDGTIICAAEDVQIGDDTMIAAQCYILDCNHGMKIGGGNMRTQPLSVHITQIGKNVWLGCGCKVLAGSQIQDGAVIGAGTVITRKVEQNIICYSERNYVKKIRHG